MDRLTQQAESDGANTIVTDGSLPLRELLRHLATQPIPVLLPTQPSEASHALELKALEDEYWALRDSGVGVVRRAPRSPSTADAPGLVKESKKKDAPFGPTDVHGGTETMCFLQGVYDLIIAEEKRGTPHLCALLLSVPRTASW